MSIKVAMEFRVSIKQDNTGYFLLFGTVHEITRSLATPVNTTNSHCPTENESKKNMKMQK